jgi:hypothetical protein
MILIVIRRAGRRLLGIAALAFSCWFVRRHSQSENPRVKRSWPRTFPNDMAEWYGRVCRLPIGSGAIFF